MGDETRVVRGAAVQAAPVFLDREATLEKAVALIEEAGGEGAEIVGFPEGFIPAHPIWFHFHSGTDAASTRFGVELFKNSIEIPGPEVQVLAEAAARAGTYVVMGACERRPGTFGTMYNTQVFISPTEGYLGKHQKLVATVGQQATSVESSQTMIQDQGLPCKLPLISAMGRLVSKLRRQGRQRPQRGLVGAARLEHEAEGLVLSQGSFEPLGQSLV
ncbi:MAG: nitrilase-related carbon-nitrogen hydrolase, partial [Halobacteriales archaeon]|nr:nitrilase-related carbon-nitrogen hydrolase [Halobacteriales archaeon]